MQNSKRKGGEYIHLSLNFLITVLRIGLSIFALELIILSVVILLTGKIGKFAFYMGVVSKPYAISCAFFILVEILRWFVQRWIAPFSQDAKKCLLTLKKLRAVMKHRVFIGSMWGIAQMIGVGLILAVLIPTATDLLVSTDKKISDTAILRFITWVLGPDPKGPPDLRPPLVLSAIVMFTFLSLVFRYLANNLPKEENVVSVKELGPVHQSLNDVSQHVKELGPVHQSLNEVSKHVQVLSQHLSTLSQDFVDRVMEDTDEQVIKGLAQKIVEPLQRQLEKEQDARQHLQEQVQLLKQQTIEPLQEQLEKEQDARQHLQEQVQLLKQQTIEPLQEQLEKEQDARQHLQEQVQLLKQQENIPSTPATSESQSQTEAPEKLNDS